MGQPLPAAFPGDSVVVQNSRGPASKSQATGALLRNLFLPHVLCLCHHPSPSPTPTPRSLGFFWSQDRSLVIECLPEKHEAQGSSSAHRKEDKDLQSHSVIVKKLSGKQRSLNWNIKSEAVTQTNGKEKGLEI